jgi:cytochrome oxidase Cu insertion factor (SCO1/SenC/PrrC family)
MANSRGRTWVLVMLIIIVVLPLFSVLFLKEGFKIREEAPSSDRLIENNMPAIPNYYAVSHRGDTITKQGMLNKVCIIDFANYSCGTSNDARERKLFEIQEDYYGKTKAFRVLSFTLQPETDLNEQLQIMAERYAAREIWHFMSATDGSANKLYQFNKNIFEKKGVIETDTLCPQLVYLVDGEGFLRGAYDPLDDKQFHDLYNDVLFLVNKLDLNEETK